MKKVLFGIAFLGAMAFSGFSTNAEQGIYVLKFMRTVINVMQSLN